MALKRPWIGVMLWTWLSIMNPHRYSWGFSVTLPLAMIAALTTLIGLIFTQERQSPFKGSPVIILAMFSIWVTLSWLLGVDPSSDYPQWEKVIKIYFMIFVMLALLSNKYHIMAFAWVNICSLAALGAKGGYFTLINGGNYRVWGPPGSFIEDNNEFALSLIIIVPMLHFLQLQVQNKWGKHALSMTILLCVASALGSHSRGALVAIVAMGAVFWWRSPSKGPMTVLILLIIFVFLPMMPESWWNRMETIQGYEQDGSAMGRINAWYVAWEVAKHRVFGAGMSYQYPEFFITASTGVRAAHSIYFQILGNHGFIGLIIYLIFWFSTYRIAGWLNSHARPIPQAKWASDLGNMTQVSIIGYAVGGAFLSLAYFDLPYHIMVMLVLTKCWVQTQGWERDPKISFLKYIGLPSLINKL